MRRSAVGVVVISVVMQVTPARAATAIAPFQQAGTAEVVVSDSSGQATATATASANVDGSLFASSRAVSSTPAGAVVTLAPFGLPYFEPFYKPTLVGSSYSKARAWIIHDITVPSAGTYRVDANLTASGSNDTAKYPLNDGRFYAVGACPTFRLEPASIVTDCGWSDTYLFSYGVFSGQSSGPLYDYKDIPQGGSVLLSFTFTAHSAGVLTLTIEVAAETAAYGAGSYQANIQATLTNIVVTQV